MWDCKWLFFVVNVVDCIGCCEWDICEKQNVCLWNEKIAFELHSIELGLWESWIANVRIVEIKRGWAKWSQFECMYAYSGHT